MSFPSPFNIGQQFIRQQHKHKHLETIVDILETKSTVTGEIVSRRYVSTHNFMGQVVTDHDVLHTTISRSCLITGQ